MNLQYIETPHVYIMECDPYFLATTSRSLASVRLNQIEPTLSKIVFWMNPTLKKKTIKLIITSKYSLRTQEGRNYNEKKLICNVLEQNPERGF